MALLIPLLAAPLGPGGQVCMDSTVGPVEDTPTT